MSKKRSSRERPMYAQRFLENYGRGLKPEEIRLVQGYRGLTPETQDRLASFVCGLVAERMSEGRMPCRPFVFDAPDVQTGGAR